MENENKEEKVEEQEDSGFRFNLGLPGSEEMQERMDKALGTGFGF